MVPWERTTALRAPDRRVRQTRSLAYGRGDDLVAASEDGLGMLSVCNLVRSSERK